MIPTIVKPPHDPPRHGQARTVLGDRVRLRSVGLRSLDIPAANILRAVCEAKPGLITSADLPVRAFASRFHDAASVAKVRP